MVTQKFDIYTDDSFYFFVTVRDNSVFVHCEIFKWSNNVLRRMLNVFSLFSFRMSELGYSELYAISKETKLVELFGGRFVKAFESDNDYGVYKWDLTQTQDS